MVQKEVKLADKINVTNIQYITNTRSRSQRAIVSFANSTKTLRFNYKMIMLLQLSNWTDVVAGYERKSKIIVLKKVDPETPGAMPFRYKGKDKNSVYVSVGHIASAFTIDMKRNWRAERNGDIILLEAIEEE